MQETSQNNFWLPGGPGGQVIWGGGQLGGPVFLKSAFLVFLVIFLQTWAEIDARHLPKMILTPRGAKGARGASKWGQLGGQFSQNLQSALWKVILMSLLAHKWTIRLASVHFVVRMLDQRINSSCSAWKTTLTTFWGGYISHFCGCFTLKDSQRAKTKVLKIQILVTLL